MNRRTVMRTMIAGGTVLATGLVGALTAQAIVPLFQSLKLALIRLRRGTAASEARGSAPVSYPTPMPGTPTGAIGNIIQVPLNSAFTFQVASNTDPGVVIHLSEQTYVAYDTTCTHEGCTVGYDPTTQALICPCHGAAYDPSNNGAVLAGPMSLPLTALRLRIDSQGNIFVSG